MMTRSITNCSTWPSTEHSMRSSATIWQLMRLCWNRCRWSTSSLWRSMSATAWSKIAHRTVAECAMQVTVILWGGAGRWIAGACSTWLTSAGHAWVVLGCWEGCACEWWSNFIGICICVDLRTKRLNWCRASSDYFSNNNSGQIA